MLSKSIKKVRYLARGVKRATCLKSPGLSWDIVEETALGRAR